MARIVILWNEHPTETIAGYHARKVVKLLEKQGHEVILEKIPFKDSNCSVIAGVPLDEGHDTTKAAEEAARKIQNIQGSSDRAMYFLHKYSADFCFNFHSTHHSIRNPERLQVIDKPFLNIDGYTGHIEFQKTVNERAYTLELPALKVPLPPILYTKRAKQLQLVRKKLRKLYGRIQIISGELHLHKDYHLFQSLISLPNEDSTMLDYFLRHSPLRGARGKSRQEQIKRLRDLIEKYKHQSITKKIADFIHQKTLS